MSIVVAHTRRRQEILEHALDVFIAEGFESTTFQKIADQCKITRTTLYTYFKNKREIFTYSIKQLMESVEKDIIQVRQETGLNHIDKLIKVIFVIMDRLEENRRLLMVVLDYLRYLSKGNENPDSMVRRRTIRLRHILATMIIEGIRAGEIRPVNVRSTDDLLYGLIEAAIFRLTILNRPAAGELKQAAFLTIQQLGW